MPCVAAVLSVAVGVLGVLIGYLPTIKGHFSLVVLLESDF